MKSFTHLIAETDYKDALKTRIGQIATPAESANYHAKEGIKDLRKAGGTLEYIKNNPIVEADKGLQKSIDAMQKRLEKVRASLKAAEKESQQLNRDIKSFSAKIK